MKIKKMFSVVLAIISILNMSIIPAHAANDVCQDEVIEYFDFAKEADAVIMGHPICRCGGAGRITHVDSLQILQVSCPRLNGYHYRVVSGAVYMCSTCGRYIGADKQNSTAWDVCIADPFSTECFNPNPKTVW